ncbi:hypothetical protein OG590_39185 (plasmid) [Streptomyces goshikiensis]|nr:hypothetical protein OG590_39185 [Streptomyces goshikiensis]
MVINALSSRPGREGPRGFPILAWLSFGRLRGSLAFGINPKWFWLKFCGL